MGIYDLPAIVHSLRRLGSNLRYVGFETGNMQMFYGLTQLGQQYFSG